VENKRSEVENKRSEVENKRSEVENKHSEVENKHREMERKRDVHNSLLKLIRVTHRKLGNMLLPETIADSLVEELKPMVKAKLNALANGKIMTSFYNGPYIDPESMVDKLIAMCNAQLMNTHSQETLFIALVQPSMFGKTRLMFEVSLKRPLLIVAFKNQNVAYKALKESCLEYFVECDTFEKRLLFNRLTILKTRLFLFSYVVYFQLFMRCFDRPWDQLTHHERMILNSLVLNGGGEFLNKVFQLLLFYNAKAKSLIEVETLGIFVKEKFSALLQQLGCPTFGLDECHVPASDLIGCVFHTDYKTHSNISPGGPTKVLSWQNYEIRGSLTRDIPDDYPYKASTSLYSVFRYILEELLLDNKAPVASVFASTNYLSWSKFLDTSLHSREKLEFIKFWHSHILTQSEINTVLQTMKAAEALLKCDTSIWASRPGFFFACAYQTLLSLPIECTLDEANAALTLCKGEVFQRLSRMLLEHPQSYKRKVISQYWYCELLQNSQVSEKFREDLIACGLAVNFTNEKTLICEPMVKRFMETQIIIDTIKDSRWSGIQEVLVETYEGQLPKLFELAMGLQLVNLNSSSLLNWIDACLPVTPLPENARTKIGDSEIRVTKCASVAQLGRSDSCIFHDLRELNLALFPGVESFRFPDLSFTAASTNSTIVFVSMQMKFTQYPLSNTDFLNAIQSTSIDHLFSGHPSNQKQFREGWSKVLKDDIEVFYLRIVVCWAGFTSTQVHAINEHNTKNPNQPILLLCAKPDNVEHLFGRAPAHQLLLAKPIESPIADTPLVASSKKAHRKKKTLSPEIPVAFKFVMDLSIFNPDAINTDAQTQNNLPTIKTRVRPN